MRQARVLTDPEYKRLLAVVAQRKHAERDRIALMLSHLAGLRVGEIAGLILRDVFEADGSAREQLRVRDSIAKGGHERGDPERGSAPGRRSLSRSYSGPCPTHCCDKDRTRTIDPSVCATLGESADWPKLGASRPQSVLPGLRCGTTNPLRILTAHSPNRAGRGVPRVLLHSR